MIPVSAAADQLAQPSGIFHFSDEQLELRSALRRFLAQHSSGDDVRAAMVSQAGYDARLWKRMAAELGLQGILVPEHLDGVGLCPVDVAIVLEELGRAPYAGPYFATVVLATNALVRLADADACSDFLPSIAAGELIATVAVAEDDGRWDPAAVKLRAERTADGWALSGRKRFVLDAHAADLILVAARSATGVGLFAVEANATGMSRRKDPTFDQTRSLATVDLELTPARLVGVDGGALPALRETLRLAYAALAAEQLGGSQRCLDDAVDYAQVRVQFGRPIGSFQAIQHKCANMLVQVESARAAAYYAAWAAKDANHDFPAAASLAKAYCSDAYTYCSAEAIQIHGGIGYTWEHDAHLHFKRARSSALLFGTPDEHRELLLEQVGI